MGDSTSYSFFLGGGGEGNGPYAGSWYAGPISVEDYLIGSFSYKGLEFWGLGLS